MCLELECGICYRRYNIGRRCPRELHCKHSFCESCLLTLSRPSVSEIESTKECPQQDKTIVCPLCRCPTFVSGKLRTVLRVDEDVLEQVVASGVLEESMTDEEQEDDWEAEASHENSTEEINSSSGSRSGRFRLSLKRVWGKLTGSRTQRRTHCLTDEELRDLAMMSCYII